RVVGGDGVRQSAPRQRAHLGEVVVNQAVVELVAQQIVVVARLGIGQQVSIGLRRRMGGVATAETLLVGRYVPRAVLAADLPGDFTPRQHRRQFQVRLERHLFLLCRA